MQNTYIKYHNDQRKKPFDSHPRAKFTDPRNADTLENIDARYCVTCHVDNDYSNYTCYGCHEHSRSKIREEHVEEGIHDADRVSIAGAVNHPAFGSQVSTSD